MTLFLPPVFDIHSVNCPLQSDSVHNPVSHLQNYLSNHLKLKPTFLLGYEMVANNYCMFPERLNVHSKSVEPAI